MVEEPVEFLLSFVVHVFMEKTAKESDGPLLLFFAEKAVPVRIFHTEIIKKLQQPVLQNAEFGACSDFKRKPFRCLPQNGRSFFSGPISLIRAQYNDLIDRIKREDVFAAGFCRYGRITVKRLPVPLLRAVIRYACI